MILCGDVSTTVAEHCGALAFGEVNGVAEMHDHAEIAAGEITLVHIIGFENRAYIRVAGKSGRAFFSERMSAGQCSTVGAFAKRQIAALVVHLAIRRHQMKQVAIAVVLAATPP